MISCGQCALKTREQSLADRRSLGRGGLAECGELWRPDSRGARGTRFWKETERSVPFPNSAAHFFFFGSWCRGKRPKNAIPAKPFVGRGEARFPAAHGCGGGEDTTRRHCQHARPVGGRRLKSPSGENLTAAPTTAPPSGASSSVQVRERSTGEPFRI